MEIDTNTPKNTSSTPSSIGSAQRPGEYLRQIRMSQGKELSDVAQELKISEKQLIALEKDDYQSLPQAPFIKGYYRAYAKFLNADATALIQRFDEIYSTDTGLTSSHTLKDSPIKSMGRLTRGKRRGSNTWLKRIVLLILIIVIVWALWSVLSNWMSKNNQTQPVDNANGIEVIEFDTAGVGTGVASSRGDQLVLDFNRPTSVMIQDATGNTLAQGRQSESLTLSGQAPFSIRIDDAEAVQLKLNNEQIGLSSYTNASGSADFRLSP